MATNAVAGPSNASIPLTKNAKRRQKKKQQQQQQQPSSSTSASTSSLPPVKGESKHDRDYDGDDNYHNGDLTSQAAPSAAAASSSSSIIDQAAQIRIDPDSDVYKAFSNVLSRYQPDTLSQQQQPSKGEVIYSDDEVQSEHDSDHDNHDGDAERATTATLSKRKQKRLQRLSVAELKQLVRRPEVVEWTDVTSDDPRLLVHLKCTRNSVPIPPHWAQKRDYLQNKRGIEKAQYQLPSYIADTGIASIKDALKEKEAEQTLKQKTRERVQPKMGKMDIDYQKLYDAFFKFQSKPTLSAYGDTYYEGKEFETKFKDKRPGQLSAQLIDALSIPPLAPPPWLIAMQRYGPPPSYPHLQIPGLNAPLPQGAQWGFHPGGWGRPPVDEYGNPLYGNVLGNPSDTVDPELVDAVQHEHWGQLEPEESDPEEEEEEEEADDEEQRTQSQSELAPSDPDVDSTGLQSVSSVGAGLATPSFTELRKETRLDSSAPPRSLYHVLPERAASGGGQQQQQQLLASERVYDLSSAHASHSGAAGGAVLGAESHRGTKRAADAVEVSLNPDELDRAPPDLAATYDEHRRAQNASRFPADVADHQGVAELREEMQRQRRRDQERRAARKHQ